MTGVGLFGVGLLLSSSGALRSFTAATFFSLAPLQMSDRRALRPLPTSWVGWRAEALTYRGGFRINANVSDDTGSKRGCSCYLAEGGGWWRAPWWGRRDGHAAALTTHT